MLARRLLALLALALLVLTLLFPLPVARGVTAALSRCLTVLIPALFPTLVLTAFLTEMLASTSPGRRGWLCRLLGVGRAGASIWLLSLLAGFPHAARLCSAAVKRGEMRGEEADAVTAFSSLPGPAFLIGGIGAGMLHSARIGLWLYGIQAISSLLTALALRAVLPLPPEASPPADASVLPSPSPLRVLGNALRAGGEAMLSICASVTFFSVLISLAASLLPPAALLPIGMLTEISAGCGLSVSLLPPAMLLPLLSLICAWSGLSVHAQIALMANGSFPLRRYAVGKLLQSLLALALGVAVQNFL